MSPRIKTLRKVSNPPIIKGFKPYGLHFDKIDQEEIKLFYEEYEAIRLCDYDMLNHHQASIMMGVSRPTFTRIYASALQKIAKAMVEGKQISFEGGKIYFDSDWYHCSTCDCYFNNPEKEIIIKNCPLCGSNDINKYNIDDENDSIKDINDVYICSNCGHKQKHQYSEPFGKQICPHCHKVTIRKKNQNCKRIKKQ